MIETTKARYADEFSFEYLQHSKFDIHQLSDLLAKLEDATTMKQVVAVRREFVALKNSTTLKVVAWL